MLSRRTFLFTSAAFVAMPAAQTDPLTLAVDRLRQLRFDELMGRGGRGIAWATVLAITPIRQLAGDDEYEELVRRAFREAREMSNIKRSTGRRRLT
jgi:hypothetical protein